MKTYTIEENTVKTKDLSLISFLIYNGEFPEEKAKIGKSVMFYYKPTESIIRLAESFEDGFCTVNPKLYHNSLVRAKKIISDTLRGGNA